MADEPLTFHWSGWQHRHGAFLIIQTFSEGEIWWWTDGLNWSVEDSVKGGILIVPHEKIPKSVREFFESSKKG
jgi:hypothetical protein